MSAGQQENGASPTIAFLKTGFGKLKLPRREPPPTVHSPPPAVKILELKDSPKAKMGPSSETLPGEGGGAAGDLQLASTVDSDENPGNTDSQP